MLAIVRSATLLGADGSPVTVEVHVSSGLPGFTIVGLPDEACREARDRVRAALLSSELAVAAAARHREPGALGRAQGRVGARPRHRRRAARRPGEDRAGRRGGRRVRRRARARRLGATGHRCRAARGRAAGARRAWCRPPPCTRPPPWPGGRCGRRGRWPAWPPPSGATNGGRCPSRLLRRPRRRCPTWPTYGASPWPAWRSRWRPPATTTCCWWARPARARRCWPSACPACCRRSGVDAGHPRHEHPLGRGVAPAAGRPHDAAPPLRAPHHSASLVAMVGGGTALLRPGEVSLGRTVASSSWTSWASSRPAVLDGLRQPLEEGVVRITRARASVTLPAALPAGGGSRTCARAGRRARACASPVELARYRRRLSGPLLDRIDLRVPVSRPDDRGPPRRAARRTHVRWWPRGWPGPGRWPSSARAA